MSGFYRLFSRQEQTQEKNNNTKPNQHDREKRRIDEVKQEAIKNTGDVENCFMVQIKFLKSYIDTLEKENQKKLDAAAKELGEKAEENAVLYNKLETANAQIKALEAENKRLRDGLVTQRTRNRSASISGGGNGKHMPNSVFQRLQSSSLEGSPLKGLSLGPKVTGKDKGEEEEENQDQQQQAGATTAIAVAATKITTAIETAAEIKKKDDVIEDLNKRLANEEDVEKSLKASIAEYEKKIVALEKKLQDSLEKEKQKRMIAESNAKRFKQKIRNMQFIIDDLQSQIDNEEGSSSDNDDDDEKSGSGSSDSDSD